MPIEKLYVDASVANLPLVDRFVQSLRLPPVFVENRQQVFDILKGEKDPCLRGKQLLLLTRLQGPFVRKCPGTREYTCCDYQILNIGTFCTMDCAYCILQTYFHPPLLQYFVNRDRLLDELSEYFERPKGLRLGTGEFTDSLIWEPWSDLTPKLVERFAHQKKTVLELKTKTTAIQQLKGLDHQRKTIVSWSLNTPRVIAHQERGTASLKARLAAAAACRSQGYPLAFHFDPIFVYPEWENEYHDVIQTLFDNIPQDEIVWISMGTFRFMPALQSVVRQRFPQSDIIYGEFIPGLDGKMRYFKPLRIKVYQKIARWIKERAPRVTLYFCMEDDQVWTQCLGFSPQSKGGLPAMLDQSARIHCGII